MLVAPAHTVMKIFKRLVHLANHVHRVLIRPPRVYPVLPGATIVPRVNIQRKMEIPWKANAKIVKQIHSVLSLEAANRVTRVKKEKHQQKVQPFALLVMLVFI